MIFFRFSTYTMKYLFFSTNILSWFSQNRRNLPWRETKNPYFIWISEVILQQTRVSQAENYYKRFVLNFPFINELADAPEDEVLKIWQGLGYYTRARNMHKGAKYIVEILNGEFPRTPEQLIKIPGIGSYTAAAIASIAFNYPAAAVDGNIYRVISRFFNISTPIDTSQGKKEFQKIADELIDKKRPGEYNQAVMEFGALHCTPKIPNCANCPLQEKCMAYANKNVLQLPVKKRKTKQSFRYFNYLVIEQNNSIFFYRRRNKDIWKNLFEFPLIETTTDTDIAQLIQTKEWLNLFGKQPVVITNAFPPVKHVLSHHIIMARFIHVSLHKSVKISCNFIKWNKHEPLKIPVSRIIEKHIDNVTSINPISTNQ